MPVRTGAPLTDSGLRCPRCDYNLTGITNSRCPECGNSVDWGAVQAAALAGSRRRGPPWERWPWYLAPVSFMVTALQTAFTPWILARQIPDRPRLWLPLIFAATCAAGFWLGFMQCYRFTYAYHWLIGAASYAVMQVLALPPLLPRRRPTWAWRYWLTITCYTTYPLPLYPLLAWMRFYHPVLRWIFYPGGFQYAPVSPPYISFRSSPLWPFNMSSSFDGLTTFLYYLWLSGLLVIAVSSVRPKSRWRAIAVPPVVLLLTLAASYLVDRLPPRFMGSPF